MFAVTRIYYLKSILVNQQEHISYSARPRAGRVEWLFNGLCWPTSFCFNFASANQQKALLVSELSWQGILSISHGVVRTGLSFVPIS